mgnify:CR=1 FL=1
MGDQADEKLAGALKIVEHLRQNGHEAFFVGGCVRDTLRGVTPGDYDIVTSAVPKQVMGLFQRTVPVGIKFGVILVMMDGHPFEVATYRTDDVYQDGRRPSSIHFATAEEDVLRRDFTVNGLLMDPLTGDVIDYVGGLDDLKKKVIRTIGDPGSRFREDYLRMLRGVRFAANLSFSLAPDTQQAITNQAEWILGVSAERISEEIQKILTLGGARRGFELLSETGLLRRILPEVERLRGVEQPARFHPEGDVWEHTMMMLDILSSETAPFTPPALAWAVLLHDVGKVDSQIKDENGIHFYGHVRLGEKIAQDIAERLRFSRSLRERVMVLIHHHMDFMNVKKMRPSRLKRFLRMPDFDLHMQLHRLDCLGSHGQLDDYDFCQKHLNELEHEALHPPRWLSGNDLIEMGIDPGRRIGEILRLLEEEQLENRITSKEEAQSFVRKHFLRP